MVKVSKAPEANNLRSCVCKHLLHHETTLYVAQRKTMSPHCKHWTVIMGSRLYYISYIVWAKCTTETDETVYLYHYTAQIHIMKESPEDGYQDHCVLTEWPTPPLSSKVNRSGSGSKITSQQQQFGNCFWKTVWIFLRQKIGGACGKSIY